MEHINSWSRRAKCRIEGILSENLTKKYCTDCPVISLCSTYAVVHKEMGIWGGTNDHQRDKMDPQIVDLLRQAYFEAGLLEERHPIQLILEQPAALRQGQMSPTASIDLLMGPNEDLAS